jgi:tetratricopeptide (TPR) repeat protein
MYTMFIQHWKKHAKHDLNLYREAYKIGVERGDLIYSSLSINMLAVTRIMIGDNLDDILDEYEKYRNFQFGNKDPFMARRFMDNVQLCKCLKGVTHGRGSLNSIDYNEEEQLSFYQRENNNLGMYYYYLTKIRVSYFFGKYRECETPAKELYRLTKEKIATGSIYVPEANFYASLAMAALYLYVPGEKKQAHMAFIKRNQKQMKAWAKTCPDNFFHKYRIIEAELARCMGKYEKAKAFYLEAIRSAHANGYLQNEGIAYERAALLEQELGRVETARQYMKQAKSCYKTYGASEKVAFLEEEYPTLFLDLSSPSGASEQLRKKSLLATAPSAGTDVLDLSTVIKSSQSLSGEVELSHLLEKIMTLSIENAGAQRGCLLLKNEEDNQLYIEAMGEVDEPI